MAHEGQLGVGTTLSMSEIMQRLVDNARFDLQVCPGQAATILSLLWSVDVNLYLRCHCYSFFTNTTTTTMLI